MRTRKGRAIGALCLCALLLIASVGGEAHAEWSGNYLDAKSGVVAIMATNDSTKNMNSFGTGSGFGVGTPGEPTDIFVTNRHVVFDEERGAVSKYVYIMLEDGAVTKLYNAQGYPTEFRVTESLLVRCEVLYPTSAYPEYPDVAILKAERVIEERCALPLKSGFEADSGMKVMAMGYPSSADMNLKLEKSASGYRVDVSASTSSLTITDGVISRTVDVVSLDGTSLFQHTAHINKGNSGGPLVLEKDGTVVGINTYSFNSADNGVSEYNAAVYIDYAMSILDDLGISYNVEPQASPVTTGKASARKVRIGPWLIVIFLFLAVGGGAAFLILYLLRKRPQKGNYCIVGENGAFSGQQVALNGPVTLGRGAANVLVYPPNAQGISRRHCVIEMQDGQPVLIDLGSSFGTFVNGSRIYSNTPVPLQDNDVISLADDSNTFRVLRVS